MKSSTFWRGCGRVALSMPLSAVMAIGLGCGSQEAAPEEAPSDAARSYVGKMQGTDAFVAVALGGERALAYVCDGVPAGGRDVPSIQAWFTGHSDANEVDLAGPSGGRLEAKLSETALTGTVTLAHGRSRPITGELVSGVAGLYRAEVPELGSRGVAGWIVAPGGAQRGGITGIVDRNRALVTNVQLSRPLVGTSPPAVVSKNVQGLIPSPLTADDFDSVSKD